jgi:serine/threonine protein kinase
MNDQLKKFYGANNYSDTEPGKFYGATSKVTRTESGSVVEKFCTNKDVKVTRVGFGNVMKKMELFYNERSFKHIHTNIREVMFLSQFLHPNISKIISVSYESEHILLEMPYEGINIEVWANKTPFQDRLKAMKFIVAQISSVLKFISSYNVCHGDLKPENILINPETLHVTVIDWGSCSFNIDKRTFGMCSEGYASPKSKNGLFDLSDDVFSLGMVIAHIIYRTHESTAEKIALLETRGNCFDVEYDTVKNEIKHDFYCLVCMLSSRSPPPASYVSDYLLDVYNPPENSMSKINVTSDISSVFLVTSRVIEHYIRKILNDNYHPRALNIAMFYLSRNGIEFMSQRDSELLGYAAAYIEDIIVENDEHINRAYREIPRIPFVDIKDKALNILITVRSICT